MKKLFVLIVCIISANTTFAQKDGFSWGVKAGLNIADFNGKDVKGSKMKAAYHAGVVTEFGIADWFAISPELMFSAQGFSMKDDGETLKLNANYINLPIMAKFYVLDKLSIDFGPQLGYAVSIKSKLDGEKAKIDSDDYKGFDVALGAGVTYNFCSMFASARYNYGLTNVIKEAKNRNGVIQVSLGYKF